MCGDVELVKTWDYVMKSIIKSIEKLKHTYYFSFEPGDRSNKAYCANYLTNEQVAFSNSGSLLDVCYDVATQLEIIIGKDV